MQKMELGSRRCSDLTTWPSRQAPGQLGASVLFETGVEFCSEPSAATGSGTPPSARTHRDRLCFCSAPFHSWRALVSFAFQLSNLCPQSERSRKRRGRNYVIYNAHLIFAKWCYLHFVCSVYVYVVEHTYTYVRPRLYLAAGRERARARPALFQGGLTRL